MLIREISPFPLRLRDELKNWLKDRAAESGNSLNKEISILLTAVKGQIEKQKERKQVT